MLPSLLRAALVTLVAYTVALSAAPPASAAPSLTVKTSTQNANAAGLRNLEVTTTITNTGDDTLKLLNDPRGLFSSSPENAFVITDSSGSHLPFGGTLVNHPDYTTDPSANAFHLRSQVNDDSRSAADPDHPAGFTVIAPGVSINITHDLSAAYNLIQSGAGDYSVKPSSLFTYVDADGNPKDFYATVEGVAKVKLSRDLAAYKRGFKKFNPKKYKPKKYKPKKPKPDTLGKQPTFRSCPNHREIEILTIAKEAEEIIDKTYAYVKKLKHPTPRYTTWYGTDPGAGMGGIKRHWKKMSKNELTRLSTFWYGCSCPKGEKGAIVYEPSLVRLTLCTPFWDLPADEQVYSFISKASTFRENGFASDYAEGEADCEKLARERPEDAGHNADSFKYFAWNKEGLE